MNQVREEFEEGLSTGRFIAVNSSEKADADWIAAIRAPECDARECILPAQDIERSEEIGLEAGQMEEWCEELLERAGVGAIEGCLWFCFHADSGLQSMVFLGEGTSAGSEGFKKMHPRG